MAFDFRDLQAIHPATKDTFTVCLRNRTNQVLCGVKFSEGKASGLSLRKVRQLIAAAGSFLDSFERDGEPTAFETAPTLPAAPLAPVVAEEVAEAEEDEEEPADGPQAAGTGAFVLLGKSSREIREILDAEGIEYDGRWGRERLRQAYLDAKG